MSASAALAPDEPLRPLNDQDREILAFERGRWKYPGAKETEVRARFDMSIVRYAQVVDYLLDHPDAEAYDAVLVRRLRRLRDARRAQRAASKEALRRHA